MSTKDGGPAFPSTAQIERRFTDGSGIVRPLTEGGMTLRDYLATEAMHAFIRQLPHQCQGTITRAIIAENAYLMADEMLKAREA